MRGRGQSLALHLFGKCVTRLNCPGCFASALSGLALTPLLLTGLTGLTLAVLTDGRIALLTLLALALLLLLALFQLPEQLDGDLDNLGSVACLACLDQRITQQVSVGAGIEDAGEGNVVAI